MVVRVRASLYAVKQFKVMHNAVKANGAVWSERHTRSFACSLSLALSLSLARPLSHTLFPFLFLRGSRTTHPRRLLNLLKKAKEKVLDRPCREQAG